MLQLALARGDTGQPAQANGGQGKPGATGKGQPASAIAALRAASQPGQPGAAQGQNATGTTATGSASTGDGSGTAATGGERANGQTGGKGDADAKAALERARQQQQVQEELKLKNIRVQTAKAPNGGTARSGNALAGGTAFAAAAAAQSADSGQQGQLSRNPLIQQPGTTNAARGNLILNAASDGAGANATSNGGRGDASLVGRLMGGDAGNTTVRVQAASTGAQAGGLQGSTVDGQTTNPSQLQVRVAPQGDGGRSISFEGAQARVANGGQSRGDAGQLQGQQQARANGQRGGNAPTNANAQTSGQGAQSAKAPGQPGSGQAFDPVLQGNQTSSQSQSQGQGQSSTQLPGQAGQSGNPGIPGTGTGSDAGSANARAANGAQGSARQAPSQPVQQQVAVHVSRAVQNGQSRMNVQLSPPELGRVDVKLDIADDGRVRASLTVDKAETLDLMQRDVRSLEKALQDAGLQASQEDLNFNLRDQGGRSGNQDFDQALNGDGAGDSDDDAAAGGDGAGGLVSDDAVNIEI
jgi:flagellar hook-length control protein FliK